MRREKVRKKITLFGHFGQGNFGNESTLQAILYNLYRFLPDAEVNCITSGPEGTAAIHKIEAITIAEILAKSWNPRNPIARLARMLSIGLISEPYRLVKGLMMLRRTDLFIIPGTGLLTDAYGLLSWGPYNLFKWSLTAKLCRCKLLFVSVGAGPIYGMLGRWFVKSALSLADFRSYRDRSSLQYLTSIGFYKPNDFIYPDLAFSLPDPAAPDHLVESGGRRVIGLGLMYPAGKYSVPTPSNESHSVYLGHLVKVVRWVIAHGYDVRLLIGDLWDKHVTEEFKRQLKGNLSPADERHIVDVPISSVEQLFSELAATDIVVATRFHNVLLAMLCNKPVIAISFHHKCVSLMNDMGLSEYWVDINSFTAERLIERICELERNSTRLKVLIREKVERCRERLNEQYKLIFDQDVAAPPIPAELVLKVRGSMDEVLKYATAEPNRVLNRG